nr:glycoside hydrolase family 3 C-terminal domain-containing protein [Bacteroidales bacterium]
VWPHWLNSFNGNVVPFSVKDNGADLVETSFMVQGLITTRQYMDENSTQEKTLIDRINVLCDSVEWDWFTKGGEDVLYWHWSPNYGWDMNMKIRGYNETLITYVLAASSTTHAIDAPVYHSGYAKDGGMINGNEFFGINLPLGYDYGGPLFFAHYSFLGLDPRNLSDQYANYWDQNVNHSLINNAYCIRNSRGYKGYSADCWGLTASDERNGYSAHSPTNDNGTITPTAAISSIPYTPEESIKAIRHFYYILGDKLWGQYGFYDAFNINQNWWANSTLAIDQGPIVIMIENYRTGLLWDLFMSAPEVQEGLLKLGFSTSKLTHMNFRTTLAIGIFILSSSCNDRQAEHGTKGSFIDTLMEELTMEEMVGQLTLYTSGWTVTGPALDNNYRQDIVNGMCGNIFNAHTVSYNTELQRMAVEESRLGIPLIFGYDVIHGHKTIFPIPLGESCSWDPDLAEKSAALSAKEAAASGINWTFSPVMDISRDPRWGRISEGAGEDPYLGSLYARARVRGYQGSDLKDPETVAACMKHFAVYGAPQAGRDYSTVDLSERTITEVYMPPYKAAAEEGVATVMVAFNEINGIPATMSPYIKEVLRNEWDFQGLVVTDYGAINELIPHGVAANRKQAAELAFKAGVDMDMQSGSYQEYLMEMVNEGLLSESDIEVAARRIMELKWELGLFEDPYRYLDSIKEVEVVHSQELMDHALLAGKKSMVLLKNEVVGEAPLLPLNANSGTIAVIGPMAQNKVDMMGSWHAAGEAERVTTLEAGLKNSFPNARIRSAEGCDFRTDNRSGFQKAIALAKSSDIIILALGEDYNQSGEAASRSDIGLPGMQQELIEAIVKTGKPIVAVVFAGRPLTIGWLEEHVPAILYAWQPGTRGGDAVAEILSGKYNPSGRLSITFPRNVGQIPIYYSSKNSGRPFNSADKYTSKYIDVPNDPLYPFGYGLSYSKASYSALKIEKDSITAKETLKVQVTIKNEGAFTMEETVQLYVHDLIGSVTRPIKELKGFKKVSLEAGEQKDVEFSIVADDLKFYDREMNFSFEPGAFMVFIGPNSRDLLGKRFYME